MNIRNLINLKIKEIKKNTIIFTVKTRLWCKLSYPGHVYGCPNFNKKPECPKICTYLKNKVLNFNYFNLFYVRFDFKRYKNMMHDIHSNWSERQLGNSLWWQSQIKKIMRLKIERYYINNYDLYLLFCGSGIPHKSIIKKNQRVIPSMEAGGIYVFKTLKNNNIDYEIKPKNFVILTALLCSHKKIIKPNKQIKINEKWR